MPQLYKKIQIGGKTVQLSRHIMEQALGRKLSWNEIVHHRNEDKFDNRIENLEVMTRIEHSRHHNQRHPISKPCAVCKKEFTPHKTKRKRQVTCSRECFASLTSKQKSKLSPEQYAEICAMYATGKWTQQAIADIYGMERTSIGLIVRRAAK